MDLAVVVTVTVKGAAVAPSMASEVGETEQVAPKGAPLQLRFTLPLKPLTGRRDRS